MRLLRFLISALVAVLCTATVFAQDARWITASDENSDKPNTWIEFRKDFSIDKLDKKLSSVEAEIAVDSKYWLWVNGEMVVFEGGLKRGPNPNDSYYDVVELLPYLNGEKELGECIESLKRSTRRYAKRQLSYWGRDKEIKWLEL